MLDKLRIGPKLLLAPALVLLLLILSSSAAFYAMVRQNQSLDGIVHQRAARIKEAAALVASAQQAHTYSYQLLTWIGASFNHARVQALVADIDARHASLRAGFAAMGGRTAAGGAERRYIEQAAAAHALYHAAVRDVIELSQVDHSMSANAMSKAERAFIVVELRLGELARLEQALSERAAQDADTEFRTMSGLMLALVALSIGLSLIVTMAVRDSLLREVRAISDAAIDLASGNLTVRKRSYGCDEIADTSRVLDSSIRNLNATLRTIRESADSIDIASREFAGTSSLAGAAAGSEAGLAERLARKAARAAERGAGTVERLLAAIAANKGRTQRVLALVELMEKIACRTNLLALNTGGDADSDGEGGAQMRMLAQRSAAAARAIRELADASLRDLDGSSAAATEAGRRIADIVDSVQQVGAMVEKMGQAHAGQAVMQIDQMTRPNSALVQQAAAAAKRLQQQALNLSRAMAGLKLDDSTEPPAAPADAARTPAAAASGKTRHLRLASNRA